MLLKAFFTSLMLFIILIKKSRNQIPININTTNSLSNSKVNCSYPCISICQADSVERFYNSGMSSEDLQQLFEKEIIFYKSRPKAADLSKYFNRNVSQPCNKSLMYPLLTSRNDEWSIYEDGMLYLHYDGNFRNQQQYCFDGKDLYNETEYEGTLFVPYVCSLVNNHFGWDQWKNWAMVFSLPFFLLTIFFYCFLPELKNCHGKCFIMYLTYLTLSYGLISYATLSPGEFGKLQCVALGFLIYFANISFLTWISIISYDTYIALTGFSYSALFRNYLYYGSIIPIVITLLAFVIQKSDMIEDGFKPGIERGSCAFQTKRWSAMLYYYTPHIIVLICCLFMFIRLIIFLQHHEKNATKYAGKIKTSYKKRFTIYFRLFIFTGLIWFVEILSYIMYKTLGNDNYITIILDYFNALHGLFIFLCVICSSNFCRNVIEKSTKKRLIEHGLRTAISMDGSLEDEQIVYLH